MSLNWGVTDLLAVTKLAWDLYHKCFLVACEAPDDFRQLVNELASLQSVLRSLRDDVTSDKSFLDKMGENRKEMLERCLVSCFDTLHKLKALVARFSELGNIEDGLQFWKKLKWVFKQGEISKLRSKIMVHSANLNLCMSAIGNSSLRNLELKMLSAVEREQATQEDDDMEEKNDVLAPLGKTQTEPVKVPRTPTEGGSDGPGISRAMTGSTLVPGHTTSVLTPELTPSASEEDGTELGSHFSNRQKKATANYGTHRGSLSSPTLHPYALPPSPLSSDKRSSEDPVAPHTTRIGSSSDPTLPAQGSQKELNVAEAVAEAMRKLSVVNNQQRAERATKLPRQNAQHAPNEALKRCFQRQIEEELRAKSLNTRDWLKMGTWWLMKAQFHMRSIEVPQSPNGRESFSISSDSSHVGNQAYIDLLKASWIMNNFIIKGDSLVVTTSDENRKLLHNLANGLRTELSKFKPIDALSEQDTFDEKEYDLFEMMQPEEEDSDSTDIFGPDPGRYITEEIDDAGFEDEIVRFRTFVNAEIGLRRHRVKSAGAPYLLCLSSKDGVSEPRVTLCNQSCTMELARDFTVEDLQKPKVSTSHVATVATMNTQPPYPLDFGNMKTTIAFTNEVDLHQFMNIPKRYFDAVRCREPRVLPNATETILFKRPVELYERLRADTMKSIGSQQKKKKSCDLRVLETTSREGWKTVRRLVVSSSFEEETPWSTDYFLPLSRVQVKRDEEVPRRADVKWSDCSHEVIGTDGYYNDTYNYIYNEQNPNIAISVYFRNTADAAEFESKILTLSVPPIYPAVSPLISTLPVGASEKVIYNLSDSGPDTKNYKAILITHTRHDWRYGELYYVFRNLDFIYEHANLKIRFPSVTSTTYISNFCDDKTHRPLPNDPVRFSHCIQRKGTFTVDFEDPAAQMSFMSALRPGWTLVYSRRALSLSTRAPSRFSRQPSSKKGPTEIQLWQKQITQELRLMGRWGDIIDDKWLTLSLDKSQAGFPPGRSEAILGRHIYQRGRKIDMQDLRASDAKDVKGKVAEGPITVFLERMQDREAFEMVVTKGESAVTSPGLGGLGKLMIME